MWAVDEQMFQERFKNVTRCFLIRPDVKRDVRGLIHHMMHITTTHKSPSLLPGHINSSAIPFVAERMCFSKESSRLRTPGGGLAPLSSSDLLDRPLLQGHPSSKEKENEVGTCIEHVQLACYQNFWFGWIEELAIIISTGKVRRPGTMRKHSAHFCTRSK